MYLVKSKVNLCNCLKKWPMKDRDKYLMKKLIFIFELKFYPFVLFVLHSPTNIYYNQKKLN